MITPSYMPFLRLIYHLLLLSTLLVIFTLLALKFLGTDYHAAHYYQKLKHTLGKYSSLRFAVICLILALGFATNYCFSDLQGSSMEPNFLDGELVLVRHHKYKLNRGDLVVLRLDEETSILKRLIGFPGDTIELPTTGGVLVNWKPLNEGAYLSQVTENELEIGMVMDKDEYFVLGDNRDDSYDSRDHGGFHKEEILGKVVLKLGSPPRLIMDLWHKL